ncbi:MAG: hypothetical protein ACYCX4_15435 [Bacillota bacterium]
MKKKKPPLNGHICYGLEEEVFITEPDQPSLQSLYYLARLMWKSPRFYYTHTACNFTRGKDLRAGIMSGVEISTDIHGNPLALVEDLARRRKELSEVCEGLLVPVGHLFDRETPTNVCGMHIHISGTDNLTRVFSNLIYFLPLLGLLTANSPLASGSYRGPSYRWAHSFAIGALRMDHEYRFQDLIYSKRLGTIEIRLFDPVWDLKIIRLLLDCIDAVVRTKQQFPGKIDQFNRLRVEAAEQGYTEEIAALYRDLRELIDIPEAYFAAPPAMKIFDLWKCHGTLGTYAALDNAYRGGQLVVRPIPPMNITTSRVLAGFLSYYLVKLPYNLRKVLEEW